MEAVAQLLDIMRRLRDPHDGCPWDREQTFATIVPHTLEEAYEVADAIEREDWNELRTELGDLLFQIVFYAQMGQEQDKFDFEDIVVAINDKLVRRHPHVFADEHIETSAEQTEAWEQHKLAERQAKSATEGRDHSVLDGVARGLPALTRAAKLQRRAARVGFDWKRTEPVMDKLREEIDELQLALDIEATPEDMFEELGDVIFTCVNLARHLDVDAESALRHANAKFEDRFRQVEAHFAERGGMESASAEEMDQIWEHVKRQQSAEQED
ncbi:MAG: nucleoside triphosphate hydrolase [Gammaproteobacteria bacterium SG8_47]|nr:MAG: nucleoside triphosphate hydrolase [Gammaproteobacteria bacterium SG8_47]